MDDSFIVLRIKRDLKITIRLVVKNFFYVNLPLGNNNYEWLLNDMSALKNFRKTGRQIFKWLFHTSTIPQYRWMVQSYYVNECKISRKDNRVSFVPPVRSAQMCVDNLSFPGGPDGTRLSHRLDNCTNRSRGGCHRHIFMMRVLFNFP